MIFKDLAKFSLLCPKRGPAPLF